jgi:hypothetical protein
MDMTAFDYMTKGSQRLKTLFLRATSVKHGLSWSEEPKINHMRITAGLRCNDGPLAA